MGFSLKIILQFAFRSPQRYAVLNISSKFQDHLPQKLTTIKERKFDIKSLAVVRNTAAVGT